MRDRRGYLQVFCPRHRQRNAAAPDKTQASASRNEFLTGERVSPRRRSLWRGKLGGQRVETGHPGLGSGWIFHRALQVILYTDLLDQAELGFQPIDVLFLRLEYAFEQFPGAIVLHRLAVRDGLA